jgi:hypothetical protein
MRAATRSRLILAVGEGPGHAVFLGVVVVLWLEVITRGSRSAWVTTMGPYHGPADWPLIVLFFVAYVMTYALLGVRRMARLEREDQASEARAAAEVRFFRRAGEAIEVDAVDVSKDRRPE